MSNEYRLYFNYEGSVISTVIRANYNPEDKMDKLVEDGKTFYYNGEEVLFEDVLAVMRVH